MVYGSGNCEEPLESPRRLAHPARLLAGPIASEGSGMRHRCVAEDASSVAGASSRVKSRSGRTRRGRNRSAGRQRTRWRRRSTHRRRRRRPATRRSGTRASSTAGGEDRSGARSRSRMRARRAAEDPPDEEGDTRPDETRCQHQATHGRGLWQRGLNLVEAGDCPGEDVRERQALRESVTLRQFGGAATLSGHALGGRRRRFGSERATVRAVRLRRCEQCH